MVLAVTLFAILPYRKLFYYSIYLRAVILLGSQLVFYDLSLRWKSFRKKKKVNEFLEFKQNGKQKKKILFEQRIMTKI